MFFALLIQKQIKKNKVKHTHKKNSQIKSNLLFYFHQVDGKRPCLFLSASIYILNFLLLPPPSAASVAAVAAAAIRFVLCSAPKQCDTTNDTLVNDDINDNERRWRRKNDDKKNNWASKQETDTHTHTHTAYIHHTDTRRRKKDILPWKMIITEWFAMYVYVYNNNTTRWRIISHSTWKLCTLATNE